MTEDAIEPRLGMTDDDPAEVLGPFPSPAGGDLPRP